MRETHRDAHLITGMALGTLNSSLLVLSLVLPLYLLGELGGLLEELNTALGLGAFALLWSVTCVCTYKGLQASGLQFDNLIPVGAVLSNAFTWGARNGMIILYFGLIAGLVAATAITLTEGNDIRAVFTVGLLVFGFGTIVSAGVGAVLGVTFSLLDVALLALALRLMGVRAPGERP